MVWICFAIIFLIIAIGLHKFDLYAKLVGYHRKSEDAREEASIKPVASYYIILAYLFTFLCLILAVSSLYHFDQFYNISFISFIILFFASLLDSQRYVRMIKDKYAQPEKYEKDKFFRWVSYLSGIGVIIAVIVYLVIR